MNRTAIIAAAFAFAATPGLAQSPNPASTTPVIPEASTAAPESPDRMGAAASTGDTTQSPGTDGLIGTDASATSSTSRDGTSVPTQGLSESEAATATETTPSGGIVPGQSSN
ncbi:hypothetical protein [Aureimonas pseudogalii]|uniref:Uncharacterized protein n=1 Tax=Aureimonas pseudogalii TaxID=1744844 RepID=A0A7W6H4R9_9HYPH|nr:hypothetical protein [Aureimonas pseudogalii]MBB3997939.1 hypothetical protein [Aureimonas pseudogalii]